MLRAEIVAETNYNHSIIIKPLLEAKITFLSAESRVKDKFEYRVRVFRYYNRK